MKWPFVSKTSLTKLQRGNQRLAAKDYAAAIELFLGLMIRDNFTLNIVQLIYPNEWLSKWQSGE